MAQTAPRPAPAVNRGEEPPLDPEAVERAYRQHRALRAAKERRYRERRWANLRFWFLLAVAIAVALVLAARTLGEMQRVFGL